MAVGVGDGAAHFQVLGAAGERGGVGAAHVGGLQDPRDKQRGQEQAEEEDKGAESAGGKGEETAGEGQEREGEVAEESRKGRKEEVKLWSKSVVSKCQFLPYCVKCRQSM